MNKEGVRICELPQSLIALDMHWPTQFNGSAISKHTDNILITSTDGKFHLISRSGRIERSTDAHKGAALVGRWSNDASGFLTAGEDGQIKIWSRSGMLRSTLVTCEMPVYSAAWAPNNQAVLYTLGRLLCIRSLTPNTSPIKWKAHEGLILKVAWNETNTLIISGGEDCRYKVWDSLGQPLYTSSLHDYPISSLVWSMTGDLFAVGAYNTLRLCDFSGWSHSFHNLQTGSLYDMAWSSDGTQICAACSNGQILFAHVIGRSYEWKQYTATVTSRKTVTVQDITNENEEHLDFPEHVIHLSLAYGHLVIATPTQCHIYTTQNWNTPVIVDLKERAICNILLTEKCFAIVERSTINIYNYQGRIISSPRWQGLNPGGLSRKCISLSSDTLAIRNHSDNKIMHIFEIGGASRSSSDSGFQIRHNLSIIEIALNQAGPINDRQLVVIDVNKDIYIVSVKNFGLKQFNKLGSQIQSMCWHTETNMLAVIQDTHLIIWYCPAAACHSAQILALTSSEKDSFPLGRNPLISSFDGATVCVRRSDGSPINILVSPYILTLQSLIIQNKWSNALKLCRTLQEDSSWACLAALATRAKNLEIAEEAYSAVKQFDKVAFIQHIMNQPDKIQRMAEAALLNGSLYEAESLLLHNGLVYQAITYNVDMHMWNRALDLALKHKTHIDTVLHLRKQYLESLNKTETNAKFLQFKNLKEIDEEKVKMKIALEENKM